MPELLGKIGPDADLSPSVLGLDTLTELERALADNAAVRGVAQVTKELKTAQGGNSQGSHLVEFEDGRVVAVPFSVSVGSNTQ